MAASYNQDKKHNCSDCFICQWCANTRCISCKGWIVKRRKKRSVKKRCS